MRKALLNNQGKLHKEPTNIALEEIQPLQETIIRRMHLPYAVAWAILSLMPFLLYIVLCARYCEPRRFMGFHFTLAMITFIATAGVVWGSELFKRFYNAVQSFVDLPGNEIAQWYNRQVKLIFSQRWTMFSGMLGVVIAYIAISHVLRFWYYDDALRFYCFLWFIYGAFWCGAVIYPIIMVMRFTFKFAHLPMKITLYQHPATGLTAIGKFLFQMALSSAINFALITLLIFLSPLEFNWFILTCLSIGGAMLLCWFLLPQYRLHLIMMEFKHRRISTLAPHLEKCFDATVKRPSDSNIRRLREILELQSRLEKIPEWPFNLKSLMILITSIFIPLVSIFIKLVVQ